ncbi:MAG: FHA domain-containing protein, partial [Planctomycetes bacterium]|nr:FHA domain-containing protein [Planctomycetota bacterium]
VALKLPTVIGRGREAGLTVAHPMISRRHCELFEADGLLMVRDLGSLNGTVIDGRRIKESPLPPEGKFAIGPLTFRAQYEYEGDLNALPEAVLADPIAPQPERQESWSDSPDPEPVGEAVSFDPLTEAAPAADVAEVELSFLEDLQGEQPAAVEEDQPAMQEEEQEEEPPAAPSPPAKPAVNPAADEFDVDAFLDGS